MNKQGIGPGSQIIRWISLTDETRRIWLDLATHRWKHPSWKCTAYTIYRFKNCCHLPTSKCRSGSSQGLITQTHFAIAAQWVSSRSLTAFFGLPDPHESMDRFFLGEQTPRDTQNWCDCVWREKGLFSNIHRLSRILPGFCLKRYILGILNLKVNCTNKNMNCMPTPKTHLSELDAWKLNCFWFFNKSEPCFSQESRTGCDLCSWCILSKCQLFQVSWCSFEPCTLFILLLYFRILTEPGGNGQRRCLTVKVVFFTCAQKQIVLTCFSFLQGCIATGNSSTRFFHFDLWYAMNSLFRNRIPCVRCTGRFFAV